MIEKEQTIRKEVGMNKNTKHSRRKKGATGRQP